MIVRECDDGSTILVDQTDPAKLSGLFAAHWGNDRFAPPAPREPVMRAAQFHDHGWLRYETEPAYDPVKKTSPSFFETPVSDDQLKAYGWAIDWLADIDSYAGALISRHRTGLYRGRYGAMRQPSAPSQPPQDPRIVTFNAHYEAQQERALAAFPRAQFLINYQLLQVWDLLSLTLCMREPRPDVFAPVPTNYDGDGTDGVTMAMTPLGGDDIRLDPYPFDARPLRVAYVYRHLQTRDFPSEAAFRAAYFGAEPRARSFTLV